ncbi:MAG: hypothetical protein ACJAWV_004518 [Flammeovirgaceae bacterium]|jgi:hypothetical protein
MVFTFRCKPGRLHQERLAQVLEIKFLEKYNAFTKKSD